MSHAGFKSVVLAVAVSAIVFAAAEGRSMTLLYNDQTVTVDQTIAEDGDLWVLARDLPKINGFELKPEGACLDEICIPADDDLVQTRDTRKWFNLTELASRLGQTFVADEAEGVWSFGPIPMKRRTFFDSAIAPDFALPDRNGKTVRLSDFRGKKVLILTWASW